MKRTVATLKKRWPEYVLEILVLIIGIYGAFALERWNDEVTEEKKEKILLDAVHKEFKANKAQLEKITKKHQQVLKSTRWLIDKTPFGEDSNIDSIRFHFKQTFSSYTFNPSSSSINAIINTGSLEVIKSEELRSLLVGWADISEAYQEEERLAKNFHWNEYLAKWRPHIDFRVFDPTKKIDFDYRILK